MRQQEINQRNKIREINQETMESPLAFLQRFRECLPIYMTTAPESLEGNAILRSYFISQSAPNIRHKLQGLETEPDTPTFCLVKVAYCVFNNQIQGRKSQRIKRHGGKPTYWLLLSCVNGSAQDSAQTTHRDPQLQ